MLRPPPQSHNINSRVGLRIFFALLKSRSMLRAPPPPPGHTTSTPRGPHNICPRVGLVIFCVLQTRAALVNSQRDSMPAAFSSHRATRAEWACGLSCTTRASASSTRTLRRTQKSSSGATRISETSTTA